MSKTLKNILVLILILSFIGMIYVFHQPQENPEITKLKEQNKSLLEKISLQEKKQDSLRTFSDSLVKSLHTEENIKKIHEKTEHKKNSLKFLSSDSLIERQRTRFSKENFIER